MTAIRAFDPARDRAAMRSLFVELHETERALDSRMRPSELIADEYLECIFECCEKWDGVIFVVDDEFGKGFVGYVCVW